MQFFLLFKKNHVHFFCFILKQVIPRIVTTEAWESTLAVILAMTIAALLSLVELF